MSENRCRLCRECMRQLEAKDDLGLPIARRTDAVYCSDACRQRAYRKRVKAARKKTRRRSKG